jgi:dCMP deaminase
MFIGITGTYGAGKGTVANFFKSKGFLHFSASDLLREYLDNEGLPHSRDNLIAMGKKIREQYGTGYIIEEFIKRANGQNAVLESIRSLGEVEALKKNSGILLSVNAPIEMRYKRIISRQSSKDNVDFQTFKTQEESELNGTGGGQQLIPCMKQAHYSINNTLTVEELYKNLEKLLEIMKQKFGSITQPSQTPVNNQVQQPQTQQMQNSFNNQNTTNNTSNESVKIIDVDNQVKSRDEVLQKKESIENNLNNNDQNLQTFDNNTQNETINQSQQNFQDNTYEDKRPSWNEYFMKIAEDVSKRGTCLSAQGGAVIVRNKRILSTGYIGAPRKSKDCLARGSCLRRELNIPSGKHYEICRSVHAEQNAIINAARDGVDIVDADMYLFMKRIFNGDKLVNAYPCFICKKMIINSGLKHFYGICEDGSIKKYDIEEWVKDWSENDMIDDKVKYDSKYYEK